MSTCPPNLAFLEHLVSVHPSVGSKLRENLPEETFTKVEVKQKSGGEYTKTKRIVAAYIHITQQHRLSDSEKQELLGYIESGDLHKQNQLLQREENEEMPQASVVDSLLHLAESAAEHIFGSIEDTPADCAATSTISVMSSNLIRRILSNLSSRLT
jgi:hypothetical protein